MKPFDNRDGREPKSVPDLIRALWSLYMDMSLDPTMAVPARHLRLAVLALERTRRMAFEVCQEEEGRLPLGSDGKPRTAKVGMRRRRKSRRKDTAMAKWLRNAPPASSSKH